MPHFKDHDCLLQNMEEDVVKNFVDTGFFISLRRWFRSLCMISKYHPETSKFFKSNSACRNEEIRHLVHHYYMIHPFSMLNLYWEFFMLCLFTLFYIMSPIEGTVLFMKQGVYIYKIKVVLDSLHIIDMVKLFFTGYYDEEKSKVVLNLSKITKRYLITYFFLDISTCMHSFIFVLRHFKKMNYKITYPVRILNRVKIARLPRCLTALEFFRRFMGYSSYLFRGIRVVYILLMMTFWAFAINFFVVNYIVIFITGNVKSKKHVPILDNFYEATSMFLLISFGKYKVSNIIEYVNAIFFLCFGFFMQMFMYAQFLQVWVKFQNTENKHYALQQQFEEYVKFQKLPLGMRENFYKYFQYKFHSHFFKDSDINIMISPIIKQEILMHAIIRHVERVEFFRHFPENILTKVVVQFKTEIYLPGEVIISAGRTGSSMFFIYHGTVAVYTPNGQEICHLEDGAHFGEIALILSETRVASVVAITPCEVFILRHQDFLVAIESFPESKDQLIALATERLHKAITE